MRERAAVLGTIVLVAVLGALMAGVLAAVAGLSARTKDVDGSIRALETYQQVQRAIASEAFAEADFRRAPSEASRSRVGSAIADLDSLVSTVRGLHTPRDDGVANYLLILNTRYETVVSASLWGGSDAAVPPPAYSVGDSLDAMQRLVDAAVVRRPQIADQALPEQRSLQSELWVLAPSALVIAMLVVGLC